jgi:hypothetical protein
VSERTQKPSFVPSGVDRRTFLGGSLSMLLVAPWLGCERSSADPSVLPAATVRALEESKLAYISPLRSNGEESFCHGAIWFAWFGEDVISSTGTESWRARAIARGLGRARIWVGDHGPWRKRGGGYSEAFRQAPHFTAQASLVEDRALFERLVEEYARKYGEEKIARWGAQARRDLESGRRVLLRYTPIQG